MVALRAKVAFLMLLANAIAFMIRSCFAVGLHAMVYELTNKNVTSYECHQDIDIFEDVIRDFGPRYNWSLSTQLRVNEAYMYGYIITAIPGGYFAENFGAHKTVFLATMLSGLLTLLIPFGAMAGYVPLFTIRFITGLLGGVYTPCTNFLIANWSPWTERGKFVATLMGNSVGTIFTWMGISTLVTTIGWPQSFFICGLIALIWCIPWYIIVRNTPTEHPWITQKEKRFILSRLPKSLVRHKKRIPPYKEIFSCLPVWALIVLHFGDRWGVFLLLNVGPQFMSDALGVQLVTAVKLTSVPCIAKITFGILFGTLGDYLRQNQLISTTGQRKGFTIISHFLPGLCLFCLNFSGCSRVAAVTLITWSVGFAGASVMTNQQNSQDLAPNYAATIFGILNCLSGASSVLITKMATHITHAKSTLYEWHAVYTIGAGIYFGTGIFYLLFGSAHKQAFNDIL